MPITEAMACGAPVVASSHPSLDEASGDADSVPIRDPRRSRRRSARRSGGATSCARRARAREGFSWRRTGELFLEGYADSRSRRHDAAPADPRRDGALPARACWPPRRARTGGVFPATSRLRTLAADALWYPRLRAGAPMSSTARPSGALQGDDAARRHRSRPRGAAAPGVVPRLDPALTPRSRCPAWSRAADRVIAVSEWTERELGELLAVAGGQDPGGAERRRGHLHARRGRGPRATRARGGDARAAQEPRRASRPRSKASCGSSARAGWGKVEPPANVR